MQMRGYQTELLNNVYQAFHAGMLDVLAVAPTGSGKTRMNAQLIQDFGLPPTGVVAHRQELVSQLSLALADVGIRHDLCASNELKQAITERQYETLGQSFILSLIHI